MASSVAEVREFLEQLATRSRRSRSASTMSSTRFAGRELNAWDVAFLRRTPEAQRFDLSEEALRPYFPLPRVLAGMFAVAERLYGVRIVERQGVDGYHPDVRFYDILNADGSRRGGFFVDLYARAEEARRRVDG